MKKLDINKKQLKLHKEKIVNLTNEQQSQIHGGISDGYPDEMLPGPLTVGECDIPTIGHDDGPNCLSATDWGWCWCHGI